MGIFSLPGLVYFPPGNLRVLQHILYKLDERVCLNTIVKDCIMEDSKWKPIARRSKMVIH